MLRMAYCSSCGQKLEEAFYFCPKCGAKTIAGKTAGVTEPWESMREAFETAGEEMRKAFQKAGEEMRKAFAEARTQVRARGTAGSVSCPNCSAQNPHGAEFCQKCGKPIS
jgi:uncharacterized membrane protein YvbJ